MAAAAMLLGVTGCDGDRGPAAQPSAGVSPTTSRPPSAAVLAAPTYRLGPMPVTPTWQPPGEDGRPAFADSAWFIRYRTGELDLTVTQGEPRFGDRTPQTEHVPVQMLGTEGYRSTGVVGDSQPHTMYVVTTVDGLSVVVTGADADAVRRFAEGLRREPMPMRPPFELALLPERFAPSKVTTYSMEFVATPQPADPNAPISYVGVTLWRSYEFERPTEAIETTVNGNAAEIALKPDQGSPYIRVLLANGQVLMVSASEDLDLDQQDFERLATGITITPDATAWTNQVS
jgi:hypothetical protein